ncbi:hypothetical protein B0H63DRAFT_470687 [Podospora didyma]|uniref:Uncharacterized protein n=1 Tax=Podospora didyma TaxID=330526 RepID=A0AAE0NTX5_9PEZI|nr:hypothetical protein B0H63DRAFT_470687 [Podospora didyma]
MISPLFLAPRNAETMDREDGYEEPLSGVVISVILAMISLVIISSFLTQRFLAVKVWSRLPFVQWLVFAIYADSFLFVFATAILQFGFGVDHSVSVCEAAILLCLACYVTTKILIYMFLVEKAHIIRSSSQRPRLHSKLYIFNSFGMIGVYIVVVTLNFIYRITRVENGQCIIGMKKLAMIPLIAFDLLVNVYLTILFLIPLSSLYSYKNKQQKAGNRRLRIVAMRTFVGSVCTLASSVINLSVLMALNGEPGWVCLMCCNSDILFSAIVIQWVTSRDSTSSASNESVSLSQPKSHNAGEELVSRKSRPIMISGGGSGALDLKPSFTTPGRHGSTNSTGRNSPRTAPSTEAIVNDAGEISVDTETITGMTEPSPCSTNTIYCEEKGQTTPGVDSARDEEEHRMPRMPPPSLAAPAARHLVFPPPSEVLVHVNYGSSLSRDGAGEGRVRLGNSIVIGAGSGSGPGTANSGSGPGRSGGENDCVGDLPWGYIGPGATSDGGAIL